MEIASGLVATSNALTLVKAIRDAGTAYDTATLKAKLAEVMSELADAKMAQVAILEENAALRAENKRLLAADGDIEKLNAVDGYLYVLDETGAPRGWPACPSCLAKDKSVTFLVQDKYITSAKCPRCLVELAPVTSFVAPGLTRQEQQRRKDAESMARAADQARSYGNRLA